jgi:hypothetical protein
LGCNRLDGTIQAGGSGGQAARAYIEKAKGAFVVLIGTFAEKLNNVHEMATRKAPSMCSRRGSLQTVERVLFDRAVPFNKRWLTGSMRVQAV